MEGDQSNAAFEAEATIDQTATRAQSSRANAADVRTGQENVLAARGGLEPTFAPEVSEETPLLDIDKDGPRRSSAASLEELEELPWYKRPSLPWVIVPFSLIAIAYGGILTPRVNLIINLLCRQYYEEQDAHGPGFIRTPVYFDGTSNPQCSAPEVASRASMFMLYGNLIGGILSAFVSPRLGAMSDRHGRTKLIALTSLGSMGSDVLFILAASRPESISVNWILLGYLLDGISGSFTTAMALIHAYATDCVPVARRNVAFGYFHGCFFTGIAVGPLLAAVLTKQTGTPLTSFYFMLGVHVAFVLFIGFAVPESLSKRRQEKAREQYRIAKAERSSDWIETLRAINIVEPLKILWPTGPGSKSAVRRNLVLLAAVDTTMFGVAMGSMNVVLIYLRRAFGWETYESGIYTSITNSFRVLTLVVLLPLLTRLIRGPAEKSTRHAQTGSDLFDIAIIRIAVFFDTLGYLGFTLARTGTMMTIAGVVASVGGMGSPNIQAALTKHLPPENTGQLLGAIGLLHALARVVAPTLFSGIFSATVGKFDQAVFVCLTASFTLAFLCSWFIVPGVALEKVEPDEQAADETRQQSA